MKADIEEYIARLVRADILHQQAYHVPEAADVVKLDAMENPYAWPPALQEALAERLADAALNRYPDPRALALKRQLASTMGIPGHWQLLLGNGSDEIIGILTMALAPPGSCVLAPAPGFVMFGIVARWLRANFVEVPLAADFSLDVPAMLEAIERHRPGLVFLACPNNPSGNLFAEAEVRAIVEASPGVVVIDEAYSAFTKRSHLHLLDDYPNVLLMRTLSKLGLAGVRLGYLAGDGRWVEQLDKLRLPYNIGTLNQIAAQVALEHFELLREQTAAIVAAREQLRRRLHSDSRLRCYPSEANFLLVRIDGVSARAVHEAMFREGHVLVKCLDGAHPLLANCLRLGIGTDVENEIMLAALARSLDSLGN